MTISAEIQNELETQSNEELDSFVKRVGPTIKSNYNNHFEDEELEALFVAACVILYDRKAL